MTKETSA